MDCGVGLCGHCQLGPTLICRDGPVYPYAEIAALARGAGAVSAEAEARGLEVRLVRRLPAHAARPRGRAARARRRGRARRLPRGDEPASSRARTTSRSSRARSRPPHDAERIQEVRRASKALVTIGACATSGGDPGAAQLRRRARVRPASSTPRRSTSRRSRPRRRSRRTCRSTSSCTAARSTSASCSRSSRRSCTAAGRGSRRRASAPSASARGNVCVTVAHGTPCLGPVTHAGCGALCPAYNRGCYGCFGPMETPNTDALVPLLRRHGLHGARRRARLLDLQRGRRAVPEGGGPWLSAARSGPTTSPASRARAR